MKNTVDTRSGFRCLSVVLSVVFPLLAVAAEPEPPMEAWPSSAGGAIVYWVSTAGDTARWSLDTNGMRTSSTTISTSRVPAHWIYGGAADINNDGRAEMFWCPTNSVIKTWFLDANYQYSSNATLYGSLCPKEYQFRATGDSSGDGYQDLFFQDIYFGYIDTWHVNPDGTLRIAQPTYASSVLSNLQLRCAGNVGGDSRVELFFQNTSNGATEVWFLDTNGIQTVTRSMHSAPVPREWTLRGCGDVSGDGRVELFWQNITSGATATWFLDTNGVRTVSRAMHNAAVPSGWTMRAVVDVNGDGLVEILWQSSSGSTATWFLNTNGVRTVSRTMYSVPVPTNWTMRGATAL